MIELLASRSEAATPYPTSYPTSNPYPYPVPYPYPTSRSEAATPCYSRRGRVRVRLRGSRGPHPHATPKQAAIEWLKARTTIDLSKVAQLGGHSFARTHRPSNGMIGAELVFALQKEVP